MNLEHFSVLSQKRDERDLYGSPRKGCSGIRVPKLSAPRAPVNLALGLG